MKHLKNVKEWVVIWQELIQKKNGIRLRSKSKKKEKKKSSFSLVQEETAVKKNTIG